MATLKELSYNILNIARGGLSSDDDRLNIRQVKFWIKYYRSYLIKKNITAEHLVNPQLIQDLGCVELTEVDKADCPELLWGQVIKKAKIPKLVDLANDIGVLWVGLIDKQTPILICDPNVLFFKQHQRFTGNMRRAYLIGDYLYVTDPFNEDICMVNIRGIFDDPIGIEVRHRDGEFECIGEDDQYPMPESYVADITALIMQRELQMTVQATNDENNDSREANTPVNDPKQLD